MMQKADDSYSGLEKDEGITTPEILMKILFGMFWSLMCCKGKKIYRRYSLTFWSKEGEKVFIPPIMNLGSWNHLSCHNHSHQSTGIVS